jgi:hypothetical protein
VTKIAKVPCVSVFGPAALRGTVCAAVFSIAACRDRVRRDRCNCKAKDEFMNLPAALRRQAKANPPRSGSVG